MSCFSSWRLRAKPQRDICLSKIFWKYSVAGIPNPSRHSSNTRQTKSIEYKTHGSMLDSCSFLRYLKGTRTCGICYRISNLVPCRYSDSSWADNSYNWICTVGYAFILNGGPIFWSNRRQFTLSTSTCEAEFITQAEIEYEVVWLRDLLHVFEILDTTLEDGYSKKVWPPTTIFADNQGAIKLTKNPKYHQKTKHILIKY